MMLAAFHLSSPDGPLSVTGLCHASASPPTTALRWIEQLTRKGLLDRRPSGSDRRVIFVSLTPNARDQMGAYLARFAARHFPISSDG